MRLIRRQARKGGALLCAFHHIRSRQFSKARQPCTFHGSDRTRTEQPDPWRWRIRATTLWLEYRPTKDRRKTQLLVY